MRTLRRIFALLLVTPTSTMAAQAAFPPTAPGAIEVKILPAGRLLMSEGDGSYFERSNNLFGPLFRYISSHDIAMTTPVEAQIEPARMYFRVSREQAHQAASDSAGVTVIDVPERRVAAIGARGAYNESNFETARNELLAWLERQPELKAMGEPFAAYWHGPMTPWFMKAFEVQVEVERIPPGAED